VSYVHFWNYTLDITPLPGIKTVQSMIALYAEWMQMNAVVLNVNYALTALSTGMNPNGFLVSHSYCDRSSHVLHMHCFMDYVVVCKQERRCRSLCKHKIEAPPLNNC
jgi:hypothetical protein